MLETFSEGMLAIVSDSYDLFNMVENILGEQFKDKVEFAEYLTKQIMIYIYDLSLDFSFI